MAAVDDEIQRRRARRRHRAVLVAWYGAFGGLAILSGRFAHSPWPVCGGLFGFLELVTGFAAMYADDWEHDFRGDRDMFLRGTLANAAVVVVFTAVGVTLPGGRL